MKLPLLFLYLLTTCFAYAQPLTLSGQITDKSSGRPVPAATIGIAAKNLFYPTDTSGRFHIETTQIISTDTITISCIGYRTQKRLVSTFVAGHTIRLQPFSTMLAEVTVIDQKPQVIKVGSTVKRSGSCSSLLPGHELAMFMTGSAHISGMIRSAGFFLSNGPHGASKGGDVTAPFRIRLYEANTDDTPGHELTNEVIIATANRHKSWFEVDLTTYQIKNPANGFFVSYGLLDAAYYRAATAFKGNAILNNSSQLATARLSFAANPDSVNATGYKKTQSVHSPWVRDSFHVSYLIRATIVGD